MFGVFLYHDFDSRIINIVAPLINLIPLQVRDYDAISRIDAWLTGLLLHIKKAINAEPDIN